MYNIAFARGILEKLNEAFPRKLHLHELQADLPAYQELPRDEWLLVVQALRLDGALNGHFCQKVHRLPTLPPFTSLNEDV